jgi:hypothetical protein
MRGNLLKTSPGIFFFWNLRYITLEARMLKVYNGKDLRCVLNFDLYTVLLSLARANEFVLELEILKSDRKFLFKCANALDYKLWCTAIQDHLNESQGQLKLKPAPLLDHFWRHEVISEEQFLDRADTFDVLLFRSNMYGAML